MINKQQTLIKLQPALINQIAFNKYSQSMGAQLAVCYDFVNPSFIQISPQQIHLAERCHLLQTQNQEQRNQIIQRLKRFGVAFLDEQNLLGILANKKYNFYAGQIMRREEENIIDFCPDGKGIITLPNYDTYEGQFKQGKYHGEGLYSNKFKQLKFEGIWQNGQPIQGTISNQTHVYRSTFISNIQKKSSKMISAKIKLQPQNIIYQGDLVLKQKYILTYQGKGRMSFPDGSQYYGDWKDGFMEGNGQYSWADGDKYCGGYIRGKRNGYGEMQSKFFRSYSGCWVDGNPSLSTIGKVISNQSKINSSNISSKE